MTQEEFDAQVKTLVGETLLNREWITDIYTGKGNFKDLPNPGDQYRVFTDQNLESNSSLRDAAHAINDAIANSVVREEPIYRGFPVPTYTDFGKQVLGLKMGDSFSIRGATSFTLDKDLAIKFSLGKAGGGHGLDRIDVQGHRVKSVLFVINKSKSLNVSPYSHWKQKEVITRGTYKVTDLDYSSSVLKITLEQTHE
jgi:hypothetical protein